MAHIYNSQLDAYTLYHEQHEQHTSSPGAGPALPALGHALAGSTGTAISNLCIYPLDLIITRLQVQRQLRSSSSSTSPDSGEYKGVLDAAHHIYADEGGLSAFYTGVLHDTGKSITDSFLFFLFYNYLRQHRLQKLGAQTSSLPVLDELAVGAFAGACSKFCTTPIANIVTRKQTASMLSARSSSAPHDSQSIQAIASQIRAEKGLQGFWSGYSASLVLTLNPSLTFFLYETFKRTLLPRSKRDDPGARLTFLMAAVSKAIASSITYPFSLAKARAQAGSRPPAAGDANEPSTKSTQDVKSRPTSAKRTNVFTAIHHIYTTDGFAALYEGIWGEIAKGFFSHGITMLVKEAVHKLIIQLYFLVLKALKRMPTIGEAGVQAREVGVGLGEKAQDMAQDIGRQSQSAATTAGEAAGEAYNQAAEKAAEAYTQVAEKAGEVYTNTAITAAAVAEKARDLSEQGKDISERSTTAIRGAAQDVFEKTQVGVRNVTTRTTEAIGTVGAVGASGAKGTSGANGTTAGTAGTVGIVGQKSGAEIVREEKGHLLGNAGEMLRDGKGEGVGE